MLSKFLYDSFLIHDSVDSLWSVEPFLFNFCLVTFFSPYEKRNFSWRYDTVSINSIVIIFLIKKFSPTHIMIIILYKNLFEFSRSIKSTKKNYANYEGAFFCMSKNQNWFFQLFKGLIKRLIYIEVFFKFTTLNKCRDVNR